MLNYSIYPHADSSVWVTFVHGAGGSSSIWFKQLREFKKQFNVLLLDLRGHGKSKPALKDAFDDRYTFDFVTEDILEVLNHAQKKISLAWSIMQVLRYHLMKIY